VAKKKGAKKAARGAKKRAAKRASRAVAGASSEALNEAAAMDDRFRTGADLTRTLTQLLSGVQSLTNGEDSVPNRLSRIESAQQTAQMTILGLQGRALTAGTASETPAPRTGQQGDQVREGIVIGWRESLWYGEYAPSGQMSLPRTSFIGRAMFDLNATRSNCDAFTIAGLFRHVRQRGLHHLALNVLQYLDSTTNPQQIVRNRATSSLNGIFKSRFDLLCRYNLAAEDADRRWLLPRGRDVFRGWPEWQVEHDDIHCQGELRLARRRVAAPDVDDA
jgi:hypothetical protein